MDFNEKIIGNYLKVAKTITYLQSHYREQPDLTALAAHVGLSPFYFQKVFSDWAGVSPKQFLKYITIEHAKTLLTKEQNTLFETADQTGLSGTSRLHDLFISIEAMTPGEYKNGGANLTIYYSLQESFFGTVIIATTSKGVCHLSFFEDENTAVINLKAKFPNARFVNEATALHLEVTNILWQRNTGQLKLHLRGTEFQIKVWDALLKIPEGRLKSYGQLATEINHLNASRAVGTAIGLNPVALLIPCHRVIRSNGEPGGYMWGLTRKAAIIGWESAVVNNIIRR